MFENILILNGTPWRGASAGLPESWIVRCFPYYGRCNSSNNHYVLRRPPANAMVDHYYCLELNDTLESASNVRFMAESSAKILIAGKLTWRVWMVSSSTCNKWCYLWWFKGSWLLEAIKFWKYRGRVWTSSFDFDGFMGELTSDQKCQENEGEPWSGHIDFYVGPGVPRHRPEAVQQRVPELRGDLAEISIA